MKIYNKLIRDRIPEIIKESGKECQVSVLDDKQYLKALDDKLQEELDEYYEDGSAEELADVVEVIYALLDHKGISLEEFEKIRLDKREKRGAFKEKLLLESVK